MTRALPWSKVGGQEQRRPGVEVPSIQCDVEESSDRGACELGTPRLRTQFLSMMHLIAVCRSEVKKSKTS